VIVSKRTFQLESSIITDNGGTCSENGRQFISASGVGRQAGGRHALETCAFSPSQQAISTCRSDGRLWHNPAQPLKFFWLPLCYQNWRIFLTQ